MTGDGLQWRIEETCFNAFPALQQVLLGSWLLRFAPAVSRRANSINPLGNPRRPGCRDIGAIVTAAEALYHARSLPTIFRIPSLIDPATDDALAARGYTAEGETCVLYGALDRLAARSDTAVQLRPVATAQWLAAMATLQGYTRAQRGTYRRIVGAIAVPARFALIAGDGPPASLAYGALHDGLLCYESVITDARRRRQGLARRIIAALAAWAGDNGATGACLQVQADNTAARALYAQFGLRELYRYHYRREPPA